MTTQNTDIELGMNVMKVDINRPWMNADIFQSSSEFVRLGKRFSTGPEWTKNLSTSADGIDATATTLEAAESGGLLPAFPVSFLIAKDVTIALSLKDTSAGSAHDFTEQASAIGVSDN